MAYDFKKIESKWQNHWENEKIFSIDLAKASNPFYVLTMFPYPSGDRLHMGHWYQYGIMDSWARFKMMGGEDLFQPMGFDAFGLPVENYAVKKGIHPELSTADNVRRMIEQFKRMGVAYDWDYSLKTSHPEYYRWTQWLFLVLHRRGLAYKKKAPVNWCPSCQTVLANEQVVSGCCERCGAQAAKRKLNQWFFRITDYADELLDELDKLDWPEKTKAMQRNWIGRSEGTEVTFPLEGTEEIKVFTTRADTLMGATFLVLAPEHPMAVRITAPERKEEVKDYIARAGRLSEVDRLSADREKTGVFTGAFACHPLTGEQVPVWIADYVLEGYGTGAVMAVPAHDDRDRAFADKFGLPVKMVISEGGLGINSGKYDGLTSKDMIREDLVAKSLGEAKVTYRLRDWLVSRQRYWGCPIPMVHCPVCGPVAVPEEDLPVALPKDVDFLPTGESPLKGHRGFLETTCPECGGPAEREADTLDTFVCSSWYYLRFPSAGKNDVPFDRELTDKILPVDRYCGEPEHACLHLLYSRFITKVLSDEGLIGFREPFPRLTHQGLVLGEDGMKMSKSRGNAISPDPYVEKYGSDVLRLYLLFGFNFTEGGPWRDGGFKAADRFMKRLDRLFSAHLAGMACREETRAWDALSGENRALLRKLHRTIKSVTADAERFMFNTSVARLMELTSEVEKYVGRPAPDRTLMGSILGNMILLLAPFAPHFAEEWYSRTGGRKKSVFLEAWPEWDEACLAEDEITLAVTVNGRVRGTLTVLPETKEPTVTELARKLDNVKCFMDGKDLVRTVYVKGKIVNFIVK